ncbi:hypothetical protein P4C99_06245 [Pontiellaceae bacterium B1224]|nr:hypothetical protein [Pontiellaceae bacterium B1224]
MKSNLENSNKPSDAGGIGVFEVEGSDAAQIGIGSYASIDGSWTQNAGSMLWVKIDRTAQGVTPILVDDPEDDATGGDVLFEDGALLDVDFLGNGIVEIKLPKGGNVVVSSADYNGDFSIKPVSKKYNADWHWGLK